MQVSGVRFMPARRTLVSWRILLSMHAMAFVAYLAAILISALLTPTLLAASTPCFLNMWLTTPFAEYPSSLPQGTPAVQQATDVTDSRVEMLQHQRTGSSARPVPAKGVVEGLPAHELVPLHARGDNNVLGQILKFHAHVDGGDSQVGKCCLRTHVMVSISVAEETNNLRTHCSSTLLNCL